MTAMKFAAIATVLCLLIQHMAVTQTVRRREHFFRAWKSYRRHIYFCRFVSFTAIGVIGAIVLEIYHETDLGVTESLEELLRTEEYITLIVLTFFISLINLLVEDQLEKKIQGDNPTVKNVWLRDIWLLWFSASVVFSVIFGGFDILDATLENNKYFFAIVSVIVVAVTYAFWMYNVVHRQLTEGDGFTATAVSRIYGVQSEHVRDPLRGFLGFLTRAIQYQPPSQILIIGPKGVGKTRWTMQQDAAYAEYIGRSSDVDDGILSTQAIETAHTTQHVSVIEGNARREAEFSLMLLDFPGENLGDHCNLPFDLRSDVLILMLPESAFNPKLDATQPFSISTADDITEYFESDKDSAKTRDYMYGLYFGLQMDNSSSDFMGRPQSGVGSFILLVNSREEQPKYQNNFRKHIESLSIQIAGRYGVIDKTRIFSHYYNIERPNETLLRGAIGSLHSSLDANTEEADRISSSS